MQTFLPVEDFTKSAEILDWRRLGKQRVEARQILNALERGGGAWYYHPAVQMWSGYEEALEQYLREVILEWIARGYNNKMFVPPKDVVQMPYWLGGPIHASHRANLLRKDFDFYKQYKWKEEPSNIYFWPI